MIEIKGLTLEILVPKVNTSLTDFCDFGDEVAVTAILILEGDAPTQAFFREARISLHFVERDEILASPQTSCGDCFCSSRIHFSPRGEMNA